MVKESFIIENLKCGGCVKTVTNVLAGIEGLADIKVDKDTALIEFSTEEDNETLVLLAKERLANSGYPVLGEGKLWQKAVSYVSCAKGKLTN